MAAALLHEASRKTGNQTCLGWAGSAILKCLKFYLDRVLCDTRCRRTLVFSASVSIDRERNQRNLGGGAVMRKFIGFSLAIPLLFLLRALVPGSASNAQEPELFALQTNPVSPAAFPNCPRAERGVR